RGNGATGSGGARVVATVAGAVAYCIAANPVGAEAGLTGVGDGAGIAEDAARRAAARGAPGAGGAGGVVRAGRGAGPARAVAEVRDAARRGARAAGRDHRAGADL